MSRSDPVLSSLTKHEAENIGALWLENGQHEHASIASFARFLLQAMQVGAPPRLLRQIVAAMDDEVRHAALCFAQAARFRGVPAGAGAFLNPITEEIPSDVRAILRALLEEGCVSETVAVAYAAEGLRMTTDPEVASVLTTIVADETRHSDLAWEFAAWLLERDVSLRPLAAEVLEEALGANVVEKDPPEWVESATRFGLVSAAIRRRVRAEVIATDLRARVRKLLDVKRLVVVDAA